jgi:hypothetical protein
MSGHAGLLQRLEGWVLVGVALDASALIGSWLLIDAAGPLKGGWEAVAQYSMLIAVPWLIHVIALPLIFGRPPITWTETAMLVVRTAALLAAAAGIVPVLGFIAFFLVMMVAQIPFIIIPKWADGMLGGFSLDDDRCRRWRCHRDAGAYFAPSPLVAPANGPF